jgi:hypothetical protein
VVVYVSTWSSMLGGCTSLACGTFRISDRAEPCAVHLAILSDPCILELQYSGATTDC